MALSLMLRRAPVRAVVQPALLARSFFGGKKDAGGRSQSKVLSDPEGDLFELQLHRVKPECIDEYLELSEEHVLRISKAGDIPVELLGAWTTMIGPAQDQAVHIWRYSGYEDITKTAQKLREDKHWKEFEKKRNKMIYRRNNQILLNFTFWNPSDATTIGEPKSIYEMRTYTLKPGALIEWGQAWENGIKYRKDEAVGGWFSQIGEMHQVHHLWAYKDLTERHLTRQAAWEFPGWDECVVRTVPLIRHMIVRVLLPAPYSPLK